MGGGWMLITEEGKQARRKEGVRSFLSIYLGLSGRKGEE